MKSYINNSTPVRVSSYPCLKIASADADDSQQFIVLFVSECRGVVVHDPHNVHGLGDYYTRWAEESFSLFDGKITMEN